MAAFNPLLNTPVGDNAHTQPSKAVNKDKPRSSVNASVLDLSRANFKTERFGTYNPFEVIDVTARDIVPLHNSHNVRTLPMKSPMLNPLQLHKDYFFVPMDAILPRTWEYIFKQPSQGDDVPADAHCLFDFSFIRSALNRLRTVAEEDIPATLSDFFRVLSLELLLSRGSLLNSLGKTFHYDFDSVVDACLSSTDFQFGFTFNPGSAAETISTYQNGSGIIVSKSRAVDLIRMYPERISNFLFVTSSGDTATTSQAFTDALSSTILGNTLSEAITLFVTVPDAADGLENCFDIRRILAYQVACAEFYTRGNIDSIYCAQLWRDNAFSLFRLVDGSLSPAFMTINGTLLEYDVLSYHYFKSVTTVLNSSFGSATLPIASSIVFYQFLQYIFGYRNSLIFGDYFIDSRTQPLATNTDHELPSTDITVFDINDSLVYQRYGNKVVKQGNDFNEYLDKIFNSRPTPDFHFPKYIRGYDCDVSGNEVAVTSDTGTGHLVQNVVSGDSSELVEVAIERPGVILGISYFDVPPLYMNYQERFFLHQNRYDDYIPDLQYLGDQKVYGVELNRFSVGSASFSYNSRYAEYKQRYGVVGGSVGTSRLPSWCFVLDNDDDKFRSFLSKLSSMFVRFLPSEFDVMFNTLSGLSLASSFHFIVMYNNQAVTSRNMLVNPNTLL